ncbi:hypothetical protein MTR67_032179 [Solanum verrucosum]|uniref:histidine kinase n=1 Tax=Solanum verrucosum TaxID=315347 RepID=A0AAF0ZIS3_SOLVR|nr:hypothetical protein MTR67_032179 [Solanum verrucosum]
MSSTQKANPLLSLARGFELRPPTWKSQAQTTGPPRRVLFVVVPRVYLKQPLYLHKVGIRIPIQGKEEKNVEIKLRTLGPQEKVGSITIVANACCSRDVRQNIVGVCFIGKDVTGLKLIKDKYSRIQGDYVGIIRSPSPLIPPIFVMDEHGRCVEWNDAMHKFTGSKREEVINQMLLGEVFTVNSFGCRVKDQDTLTQLTILLNRVIAGGEGEKLFFGLFNKQGKYIEALISANKRVDDNGRVTGVLCFLHVPSPELQYAMHVQKLSEQAAKNSLKKLAYVRLELKNPLNGINCIQNLLKSSDLSKDQRQLLKTSTMCQEQLAKIIDDTDIESIEECYMEMNSCEFNLGEVVTVVINQVMILSQERKVQVTWDSPVEVSQLYLIGDNLRLQQVLSDFLTTAILFTPFEDSSVHFRVIPRKERIGTKMYVMHLEFRRDKIRNEDIRGQGGSGLRGGQYAGSETVMFMHMKRKNINALMRRITHPSPGIPDELIQHMFHYSQSISREGLALYISQKLVKIMDGTVQYLREAERSSFIILVEFPLVEKKNN